MLLRFFDKLLADRKIIGLSFALFGGPIIYFLRDGIGLAPASSAFTAALTVIAIFLMMPLANFDRLFKPNILIYYFSFIYLSIAVLYLLFYVPNKWFTNVPVELINFILIFCFFLFILTISETSFEEKFLKVTFVITGLGALLLLFYSLKNGYTFGARASIAFATSNKEMAAAGNPHIYARSAFALFFSALMLTRSSGIWKYLGYAGALLGLLVLAMTQTFAAIIALLLAGTMYFFAKYSIKKVVFSIFNFFFGVKGLLTIGGIGGGLYYVFNFTPLSRFYDLFVSKILGRLTGIFNLMFKDPELLKKAAKLSKTPLIDSSASTRADTISTVFKDFTESLEYNPLLVIFGFGYQKSYVDSPVIQAWHDMGIIPFVLYLSIVIMTVRNAYICIKYNASPSRQFIAYFMMLLTVHSFTFGMPYGTYLWFYFAFAARFLKPVSRFNS